MMKAAIAAILALWLCGCTFALHRVVTTAEVVPCAMARLDTGAETQASKGLIDNPEFLLNLAKVLPLVEWFTNKPQLVAAIQANQALGVPSGIRLTRQHAWFVFESGKEK